MSFDYKVADLSLAEAGRHQIRLAEHEMPGLMALREEYGDSAAAQAAPASPGSLHMTVQTAVLIETLTALGAEVRWASCNIFSTQDEAAAAVVVGPHGTPEDPQGVPVFAWKGETLDGVLVSAPSRSSPGPAATAANMILDDGGDATMLVHKGTRVGGRRPVPAHHRGGLRGVPVFMALVRRDPRGRPAEVDDGRRRASTASPRRRRPASTGSTSWPRPATCSSRRSTSTTRSPSPSSTTSTASATR